MASLERSSPVTATILAAHLLLNDQRFHLLRRESTYAIQLEDTSALRSLATTRSLPFIGLCELALLKLDLTGVVGIARVVAPSGKGSVGLNPVGVSQSDSEPFKAIQHGQISKSPLGFRDFYTFNSIKSISHIEKF